MNTPFSLFEQTSFSTLKTSGGVSNTTITRLVRHANESWGIIIPLANGELNPGKTDHGPRNDELARG